jgi:cathepsin A (carboxypeptidase C)
VLTNYLETGKNPYDMRKQCDDRASGLCYPEFTDIEKWLNSTSVKCALGVDPTYNFATVNSHVQMPFYYKGQATLNSAALLTPLVNKGIRLLAYAGDVGKIYPIIMERIVSQTIFYPDGVCNYMVCLTFCFTAFHGVLITRKGVEQWMSRLEHKFHAEFQLTTPEPWITSSSVYAGDVRVAGYGSGNVTFVRIFDAG